MNDEQKVWLKQYNENIGVKEFLRLGCAVVIWILIGIGLSAWIKTLGYSNSSIIFDIFFITMFILPFFATRWRPSYLFIRKLMGNENLPTNPYPSSTMQIPSQPRPWWSYLPTIWWILIDLLLLYVVMKYLNK